MILVAARTAALDAEPVLGHGDVHRECGTRVLAAGLAMADHLHHRLGVRAVAHRTAEAPSLDRRHRIFSCLVLPTATSVPRNSGEVIGTMARRMVRAHPNSVGPSGNLNVRSGSIASIPRCPRKTH